MTQGEFLIGAFCDAVERADAIAGLRDEVDRLNRRNGELEAQVRLLELSQSALVAQRKRRWARMKAMRRRLQAEIDAPQGRRLTWSASLCRATG